jgi:hypothetical protein
MSRTTLTRGAGNRRHLNVCLCRRRFIRLRDQLLTSENLKLLHQNSLVSLTKMANFVPVLDVETKIQRKLFAQKCLDLKENSFWSTAVFSDEQRFT